MDKFKELVGLERQRKKLMRELQDTADNAVKIINFFMEMHTEDHFHSQASQVNGWLNLHKIKCADSSGENLDYTYVTLHPRRGMQGIVKITSDDLTPEKYYVLTTMAHYLVGLPFAHDRVVALYDKLAEECDLPARGQNSE